MAIKNRPEFEKFIRRVEKSSDEFRVSSAEKRNIQVDYEEARSLIYGMSYKDWKDQYQTEVSKEQLEKFAKNKN